MTQLRRRPLKTAAIILLGATLTGFSGSAAALTSYLTAFEQLYPETVGTKIDECLLCHIQIGEDEDGNPIIDFSLMNAYGADFEAIVGHATDPTAAFTQLEPVDSDGDGGDNITEISCPDGTYASPTWPGDAGDFCLDIPPPAIAIVKDPDTQEVTEGSTAAFTIQVTNTGGVDLLNVTVADALAPDCAADLGTLALGANVTYDCFSDPVTAGFINLAGVTGVSASDGTTEVADSDTASVDCTDCPTPDVVLWDASHTFSILDTQKNFEGVLYSDDATTLCGIEGSPACPTDVEDSLLPKSDELGTLYPVNNEFGFLVVDFVGGFQKIEEDGVWGEGWVGNLVDPIDLTTVIGLRTSNIPTPAFKTGAPLGTVCAGMGGASVKCSTEHYTVMEHILTCFETIPYFYGIIDLDVVPEICAENPLDNELDPPLVTLPPSESDLVNIAVSSSYSVTLKDDGKVLYRWGTEHKRPTDLRFYARMGLPDEWKTPEAIAANGGRGLKIQSATLAIDHWITNNPNDQIRAEDMENEGATGRKPEFRVLPNPADAPNVNGNPGDRVAVKDCFEGDGDFIPAGTLFKDLDFDPFDPFLDLDDLCPEPGDKSSCLSSDLAGGLTNAWFTTMDRNPFGWAYLDTAGNLVDTDLPDASISITDACLVNDDGSLTDLTPGDAGCFVKGPRWRLRANKFGQDVPALEIPLRECSPLPLRSDNIRYPTGTPTTTVVNVLDFADDDKDGLPNDSPLQYSNGWVFSSENFQNLDVNDDPTCGGQTNVNCLSINGVPMSEDFDLVIYTKGDQKPTAVFDADLRVVYETAGAVPPLEVVDMGVDSISVPATISRNTSTTVSARACNVGAAPASGTFSLVGIDLVSQNPTFNAVATFSGLAIAGCTDVGGIWIAPASATAVQWTATVDATGDVNSDNDVGSAFTSVTMGGPASAASVSEPTVTELQVPSTVDAAGPIPVVVMIEKSPGDEFTGKLNLVATNQTTDSVVKETERPVRMSAKRISKKLSLKLWVPVKKMPSDDDVLEVTATLVGGNGSPMSAYTVVASGSK